MAYNGVIRSQEIAKAGDLDSTLHNLSNQNSQGAVLIVNSLYDFNNI